MIKVIIISLITLSVPFGLVAARDSDSSFHSLEERTVRNKKVSFADFKNSPVLIVNTASGCGFTGQLEGLESLNKKYSSRGLRVIGAASNDFRQENLKDEEIAKFCKLNYGVTFPVLKKSHVKGPNKSKLFSFLTGQSDPDLQGEVKWNFEKFLVDGKGKLVARFPSHVKPTDQRITSAIEKSLPLSSKVTK